MTNNNFYTGPGLSPRANPSFFRILLPLMLVAGSWWHQCMGQSPNQDSAAIKSAYSAQLAQYKKKKLHGTILRDLAITATRMGDKVNDTVIANDYIRQLKQPYTKEDILFMNNYMVSSSSPAFDFFRNQPATVDSVLGPGAASGKISYVIYVEEIAPFIKDNPGWDAIGKRVVSKYGLVGEELLARAKTIYFFNKKEWTSFIDAAVPYIDKFGSNIAAYDLNLFAWTLFEEVSDRSMLQVALAWSKKTTQPPTGAPYLDTYANLLYKLGRKAEAIQAEEKAIALAEPSNRAAFQAVLDKMKNGIPTWK